jgi:ankyrin repeat protein
MPYRSRHGNRVTSSPAISKYTAQAWKEHEATPLARDEEDEARLEDLNRRGAATWSEADRELWDEIMMRQEEREDARCAPLVREIEGYFAHLELPALPPPLPRSSLWLETQRARHYKPVGARRFYLACEEGSLDVVERWLEEEKDPARQIGSIGLQDALACGAVGNQLHVVRYLLKAGAIITNAAVRAACDNRSLELFKLLVEHGFHPNQQIRGCFGTALMNCLDSEDITRFLLDHGADPDLGPFTDARRMMWRRRPAAPLDRTCGLALDIAAEKSSLGVVTMLLDHGAHTKYSRPLHRTVCKVSKPAANGLPAEETEGDWRLRLELLLRYGADINARTWQSGTALTAAVHRGRWDIVEFLLERGADPRVQSMDMRKKDTFAEAAQDAGVPWVVTEELQRYLDHLVDGGGQSGEKADPVPAPEGAQQNPLVQRMERLREREHEGEDMGGIHDEQNRRPHHL